MLVKVNQSLTRGAKWCNVRSRPRDNWMENNWIYASIAFMRRLYNHRLYNLWSILLQTKHSRFDTKLSSRAHCNLNRNPGTVNLKIKTRSIIYIVCTSSHDPRLLWRPAKPVGWGHAQKTQRWYCLASAAVWIYTSTVRRTVLKIHTALERRRR